MYKRFCIIAFALVLTSAPLYASPKEDLEQAKKAMEEAQARQSELAEKTKKLEVELKDLQEQLVISAQAAQAGENDLTASEEKLRLLSDQMESRSETLAKGEKNLASLIQAALKLSQTPPETAVMMPGDSAETMKAARALKMASASIRQEIKSIKLQLDELTVLKQKIAAGRSEFSKKQAGLDKIRATLKARLETRQALQNRLGKEQMEQTEKLEQLAKKAEDMQELVSSIKKVQKPSGQKGKLRPFASAKGHLRMPAAGRLVRSFGTPSGRNDISKGILIDTRGNAQVTAPYDGEVVFTGPFRGYGRLVIIRHSDDFHTLLSGLDKIDTSPGEFLLEGEPIGAMGEKSPANRLYVELRKDNQPIDPLPWIDGLAKSPKEPE